MKAANEGWVPAAFLMASAFLSSANSFTPSASKNGVSAGSLPVVHSLERHVGVPGLSAPDNPVYGGCAAHAPNEHIRLADIAPAIGYFTALLEELGA